MARKFCHPILFNVILFPLLFPIKNIGPHLEKNIFDIQQRLHLQTTYRQLRTALVADTPLVIYLYNRETNTLGLQFFDIISDSFYLFHPLEAIGNVHLITYLFVNNIGT